MGGPKFQPGELRERVPGKAESKGLEEETRKEKTNKDGYLYLKYLWGGGRKENNKGVVEHAWALVLITIMDRRCQGPV